MSVGADRMRLNPTEKLAVVGPVPEPRHQVVMLSETIAQAVGGSPGVAPHLHLLALQCGWERYASPCLSRTGWSEARRSGFPHVINESDQQGARKRCNPRPCD